MSDNAAKLADILKQTAKAHINAQIVWAKVKQVDWTKKEMTAVSLVDDLDYYNVSLGLQHYTRKPKKDSMVLLAVIENQPQHTILLFADDVEELVTTIGDLKIEIKNDKLKLSNGQQSFKDVLDVLVDQLKQAIIQTPTGPGNFSPADVQVFDQVKQNINKILS